ncbi:hypothetical protein EHW66_01975 [Erwinia psidii]|nr:hypothetical protein [Erwinia psidii]MCX8961336.1 hypothetical protein [Erwinia psidii]MCX8963817.1 hypothetical protein [Erwinia psidii]
MTTIFTHFPVSTDPVINKQHGAPHHRLTRARWSHASNPSAVMEAAHRGGMKAVYDKMLQYIYIFKHDAKGHKIGKPTIPPHLYRRKLEEAAPFRQE